MQKNGNIYLFADIPPILAVMKITSNLTKIFYSKNCLFPGLWGAPFGGCRQDQRYFWILPDVCGLRPCVRTHFLKGPCAILVRWWDGELIIIWQYKCTLIYFSQHNTKQDHKSEPWPLIILGKLISPKLTGHRAETTLLFNLWLENIEFQIN